MIKRDAEAIDDLERARYGTIRVGFVRAFDPSRARVRVAWATGETGEVLSDWVPWATWAAGHLRVWSPPAIGEQVILLSPSGEMTQAIAMPGVHQQAGAFPAQSDNPAHTMLWWDDGTWIRYERDTHRMRARIVGPVEIVADGQIYIESHQHIVMRAPRIDLNP